MRESPPLLAHNIPLQLTRFIGRKRAINAVKQLLMSASTDSRLPDAFQPGSSRIRARLVTLTGVGGSGKTRLAIEVAARLVAETAVEAQFADGVWFVELATLSNPAGLPQFLASSLTLRENPAQSPTETLVHALRDRRLLLLLDNCEHLLLASVALVETLLRNCPGLSILATSRAPLNLPGETVFLVPPLEFLNPDSRLSLSNIAQSESVRLFVDRAANARADFVLTEAMAPAVLDLCRRLDGIPLAIELAAARVTMLTPQQIVQRLGDTFRLMRSANPLAVERHQTLQATFDWSYSLLSGQERTLFQRLSVFSGGWTLAAAEQIAGFSPLRRSRLLELHQRLLDQSLITRIDDWQEEQARFRMLVPLLQYSAAKLADSEAEPQVSSRHLEYYTRLSEDAWSGIVTANGQAWLDRMEAELGNVRKALEWSMNGGSIELGLRIVTALFHFWLDKNHLMESLETMRNLLDHPRAKGLTAVRASALSFLSLSQLRIGDYEQALVSANEALVIEKEHPDTRIRAYALAGLGHAMALQNEFPEAVSSLEESLELFRELDDVTGQGWTLSRLGTVGLMTSDYSRAAAWLVEMVELMERSGNVHYLGYALRYLGYALFHQGDFQGARHWVRRLFVGDQSSDIHPASLVASAILALAVGQYEAAARLLGAVNAALHADQITMLPYDDVQHKRTLDSIRAHFDDQDVKAAWREGGELTLGQAISEAIATLDSLAPLLPTAAESAGLTPREVEVLRLLSQGLTNQQIADRLVISPRTVHAHLRSIYSKLEVTTRTAATNEARRLRLLS